MKNFNVIFINSPTQVVLNCGIQDGIGNGQKFQVYGLGPILKDINGEDLEHLEIIRGTGKVIHAQEKICTIQSVEYDEKPRTIKRKSADLFYSPATTEEIINERRLMPFEGVQLGDFARPIK